MCVVATFCVCGKRVEDMAGSYTYGFVTDVDADAFECGLNEDIVARLSEKKGEPGWMLDFRIQAYRTWRGMKEPRWGNLSYEPVDYDRLCYYSAPKIGNDSPEMKKTMERLGVPRFEQELLAGVAVDVVFDSIALGTTMKEELARLGVVLCPISEAVHEYPDLIKRYLASVVPVDDNFFAALNSAVFSDGSFVYIPKGVDCPIDLSTYFRLNDRFVGQFERTLIIAEEGSSVSYLEGCTAPAYDSRQLHAAVVELVAKERAQIRYSTVQNWYAGDEKGAGGVYNFVTKRGLCEGAHAAIRWTQVEAGAAVTWKYPSCILQGDHSSGTFYSVTVTSGHMQADSGTRMIHRGKHTSSNIVSKSISSDCSSNTYRGLVRVAPEAAYARNHTVCDSMLVGSRSSTHTFPTVDSALDTVTLEHEATTSRLREEQVFYLSSRGIEKEDAVSLIVNGFCGKVLQELPLEFAQEAKNLIALKLEHSIG